MTKGSTTRWGVLTSALTPRGAIAGRGGLLKLIFLTADRKLVGVHCIGDLASEIVGIGQMVIRCGGTIDTIANMSMNTPTYSYAYKYAAFDGMRRLATAELPCKPCRARRSRARGICARDESFAGTTEDSRRLSLRSWQARPK